MNPLRLAGLRGRRSAKKLQWFIANLRALRHKAAVASVGGDVHIPPSVHMGPVPRILSGDKKRDFATLIEHGGGGEIQDMRFMRRSGAAEHLVEWRNALREQGVRPRGLLRSRRIYPTRTYLPSNKPFYTRRNLGN